MPVAALLPLLLIAPAMAETEVQVEALATQLFLGTTGWMKPLAASAVDPTAGFELGFGLNLGPVRGRYRHLDGFRGPLEARLTEDEWRLGFEIGTVQIFGQHTRFNPGEEPRERGLGMGAALTF